MAAATIPIPGIVRRVGDGRIDNVVDITVPSPGQRFQIICPSVHGDKILECYCSAQVPYSASGDSSDQGVPWVAAFCPAVQEGVDKPKHAAELRVPFNLPLYPCRDIVFVAFLAVTTKDGSGGADTATPTMYLGAPPHTVSVLEYCALNATAWRQSQAEWTQAIAKRPYLAENFDVQWKLHTTPVATAATAKTSAPVAHVLHGQGQGQGQSQSQSQGQYRGTGFHQGKQCEDDSDDDVCGPAVDNEDVGDDSDADDKLAVIGALEGATRAARLSFYSIGLQKTGSAFPSARTANREEHSRQRHAEQPKARAGAPAETDTHAHQAPTAVKARGANGEGDVDDEDDEDEDDEDEDDEYEEDDDIDAHTGLAVGLHAKPTGVEDGYDLDDDVDDDDDDEKDDGALIDDDMCDDECVDDDDLDE